ncbi:MAG: hypothetical protein ACOC4E_03220, partial [Patescibacteria group bacterium]
LDRVLQGGLVQSTVMVMPPQLRRNHSRRLVHMQEGVVDPKEVGVSTRRQGMVRRRGELVAIVDGVHQTL